MDKIINILNYFGYISTVIVIISFVKICFLYSKGVLRVLFRLGNGLANKRIAIFAKSGNEKSLENLILDSELFRQNNLIGINSEKDLGRSENCSLFLVFWTDYKESIKKILAKKSDRNALVIYSTEEICEEDLEKISEHRNVSVVNFRGRLLNDIISFLISTSYEKK
jgi:hypothetical protein